MFQSDTGEGANTIPPGTYTIYTYVYEGDVPYLVDVEEVRGEADSLITHEVSLLEGSSGNRSISAFDRDHDLAIDRLELEVGTDPDDAASVPGERLYSWPSPVLATQGAWYKGELHAHSSHGYGSESVKELIARAEGLKLDFLAITDANTLASAHDPDFRSNSMILVPAMEWGDDAHGIALIYAPKTFPGSVDSVAEAAATAARVKAQGGVFAIAHPTYPIGFWQWGDTTFPNAVQAWCGAWSAPPPLQLDRLDEAWRARKDGRLIYSIAEAAATQRVSANGQATIFWDRELLRGLKSSVIAGSNTADPKVAMAKPVTYIYAREKSLNGLLEGLRRGRTFVSSGLDGPTIEFQADVLADGSIDAGMGSIIPINASSRFIAGVRNAEGAKVEILLNGLPIRSQRLRTKNIFFSFEHKPDAFGVYRVRVVRPLEGPGHGYVEVLAMSSPIYAQSYLVDSAQSVRDGWIEIENQYQDPREWEGILPGNAEKYEVKIPQR